MNESPDQRRAEHLEHIVSRCKIGQTACRERGRFDKARQWKARRKTIRRKLNKARRLSQ